MRFDNVFVSKWTQIRYHNTIDALKKKKRRDKIRPGVFSSAMIVVTALILDKWTQQSIPILKWNAVLFNTDGFFDGDRFFRGSLRTFLPRPARSVRSRFRGFQRFLGLGEPGIG
jgi:hypothetical protein